jgi:hypothetical protein
MYSKLGTVVAILMGAFPFAALGYMMAEDSTIGIITYGVIVLILLAGVLIGPRLNLAEADADAGSAAPRQAAPPIEWSWDGVNRQPGEENE